MTKKVKAKPTKANLTVWVEFYRKDVMFSFGETTDDLRKHLQFPESLIGKHELNHIEYVENALAQCIFFENGASLIRMKAIPVLNNDWGVLHHEITHAVWGILRRIGIKPCHKSEEAYAYLHEFITTRCYEQLNKYL
jgi:hypothetical protein